MQALAYIYLLIWVCSNIECSHLFHQNSLVPNTYCKSFHTLKPVDGDILTWSDVSFRWDDGRDGKLVGSTMPGPVGGIRFDWIGVGDLCIKLRLPCDPAFHREIPTAELAKGVCWPPVRCLIQIDSVLLGSGFLSCVKFIFLFIILLFIIVNKLTISNNISFTYACGIKHIFLLS